MAARPLELLDLSPEIVHLILFHVIEARIMESIIISLHGPRPDLGLARALRLRLVCKTFDRLFRPALFKSQVLNHAIPWSCLADSKASILEAWPLRRNHGARDLWHSYFVYRVRTETDSAIPNPYTEVRQIAETISREPGVIYDVEQMIESLCWLGLGAYRSYQGPDPIYVVEMMSLDASLLSAAAYLGHEPLVQRLLDKGNDPTHHRGLFPSAVEAAAAAGNKKMLQLLQESLPEQIELPPPDTAFVGHYALGEIWYRGKIDPQAIFGAAMTGDMDVLHMALHPPSQRTDDKDFDLVSGLDFEFNLEEFYYKGDERHAIAIHLREILPYSKNLAVYSKLVACASGFTPSVNDVARFADYGNLDMVKALLDAGAPVEQGCCISPLHEAARRGFDDIVELLISRGANVNHYSYLLGKPLRGAVLGASMSTARILLSHGAVCNQEVLKDAMLSEHTALAELILDHCTVENLHGEKFGFKVAQTVADYKLESMVELMQKRECFTYRHGEMVPWTEEKGNK